MCVAIELTDLRLINVWGGVRRKCPRLLNDFYVLTHDSYFLMSLSEIVPARYLRIKSANHVSCHVRLALLATRLVNHVEAAGVGVLPSMKGQCEREPS